MKGAYSISFCNMTFEEILADFHLRPQVVLSLKGRQAVDRSHIFLRVNSVIPSVVQMEEAQWKVPQLMDNSVKHSEKRRR